MIKSISNTPEEWIKIKQGVQRDLILNPNEVNKELIIDVNVLENAEDLIYAFPIFDSAREFGYSSILNIKTDPKNKALFESVSHFLVVQSRLRKGLKIRINNVTVTHQTRFGKIQPLFAVTNNNKNNNAFFFQKLYNHNNIFSIIFDLKPILIKSIIYKENCSSTVDNLNSIINTYRGFISSKFIKENRATLSDPNSRIALKKWSVIFELDERDDINSVICKTIMSNIIYMIENIEGDNKNQIKKEDKEKYTEKLITYFQRISNEIPLLSLYIWSILMRFQWDKKEIIRVDINNQSLFEPIMETSLNRAISFGEGLYQLIENSCFHSCSHTGYFSIRVYENSEKDDLNKKIRHLKELDILRNRYNPFSISEDIDLYIEFRFIDNAVNKTNTIGMLDHFNKNNPDKKVSKLSQLFRLTPQNENDLTEHYGLRVFERNIKMNHGTFLVSTPNSNNPDKGYVYQMLFDPSKGTHNYERIIESEKCVYNGTFYQVIMPLIFSETIKHDIIKTDSNNLFDTTDIFNTIIPYCLSINATPEYKTIEDKKEYIENIRSEFGNSFPNDNQLANRIVCIRPVNFQFTHMEILAKALIRVLLSKKQKNIRIALFLDDDYKIYEFTRAFSAFYDNNGASFDNFKLTNTEIAVCYFKDNIQEVCFVIKGNNLCSAYRTIRHFMFYYSDVLMKYVPTITYLTDFNCGFSGIQQKIFPYDLYLDIKSTEDFDNYDNHKSEIEEGSTWFFSHIYSELNSPMQSNDHGCKLTNVHIGIGSKIHIDTFYNAELLFHSYSNAVRFAYLVAKELLNEYSGCNTPKTLCLIAYGEYSLIMIQQVCDIINSAKDSHHLKAEYLVFPSYLDDDDINSREKQEFIFHSFVYQHHISKNDDFSEYLFHAIVPISTTLTTTIRIQDTIKRASKKILPNAVIKFGKTISLVLVGGEKENEIINKLFWENADSKSQRIILRPNSCIPDTDTSRIIKYFFNVNGRWYQATNKEKCILCKAKESGKRKALIGVDNTSTLPAAIFNSMTKPEQLFLVSESSNRSPKIKNKIKNNDRRVALFKGAIRYSHIVRNNNHFLYDVDYKKYTEDENVRKEIITWINEELITNISHAAFNIVVSPLHEENSFFLKTVIERGFKGNCRLINLDFHNSYRDEIRTRLGFITNELKKLMSLDMTQTVDTYFVDDCIIEGSTIQRSKQFLYMLFNEAGFDPSKLLLYKGIIVLANRSSYDTIYNFLPGRVDTDFHYFVRLNVPSFNTKNGVCPACSLSEKYRLAHKQASTSLLAREYKRLYEKHSGKSVIDYEKWLLDETRQNINSSNLLLEWIYYAVFKRNDGYYFVNVNGDIIKFAELNKTALSEYSYFQFLFDDLRLSELLNGNSYHDAQSENTIQFFQEYFYPSDNSTATEAITSRQNNLHRIIRDHIVSERAFKRLICTHDIFMSMEKVSSIKKDSSLNASQYEQEFRAAVLGAIDNRLSNIQKKAVSNNIDKRALYWLEAEWVISYIKIASRKQPGYYYHLRNAVFNILSDILDYVLFDKTEIEDIIKIAKMCSVSKSDRYTSNVLPDMKYRLFITIIRRLTAMHSSYLLEKESQEKVFKWFESIYDQANDSPDYAKFFNSEKQRSLYHMMVSFPSLEEFEFNITKLIKWSTISGIDDSKSYMVKEFLKETGAAKWNNSDHVEYVENTSIIYTGIRKLSLEIPDNTFTSDEIINFVETELEKALCCKKDKESIGQQYYELNPFRTFLDFIDYSSYLDNGHKYEINRILANQVLLFKRLCALESMKNRIDNPYDYVHICNYIRNIMQYNQCVIVSGKEQVSIVASSDIYVEYLTNDLDEEKLYEIVNQYLNDYPNKFSFDAVAKKYTVYNKTDVVVIPLIFGDNNEPGTFLIVYKNSLKNDLSEETDIQTSNFSIEELCGLRNILFVRDRFERVLGRDLKQLHNMKNSYSYVEKISESESVIMMHISDLHVTKDNEKDTIDRVITTEINGSPDLLLITGDVITGDYTAAGLKQNYFSAEKVIKALVKQIWSIKNEDNEYIRSDWKKRILISLGNHDYASMNELEAQNKKRVTTSGTPGALGDIMVKHSYFVHFVHTLLGTDIDTLLKYDMNRIVNYKKLGLSVININSNSDVNPLRTNKVRINQEEVTALFRHSECEPLQIYMIHHTPMYDIDYVDDVYPIYNLIDDIQAILGKYKINMSNREEIRKLWIELLKALANDFDKELYSLDITKQRSLLVEILYKYKEKDDKKFSENNMSDLIDYCQLDDPLTDDKCRHAKYSLLEHIYSSKKDTEEYKTFCISHFGGKNSENADPHFLILGGHTHKARTLLTKMQGPFEKCLGIFEAGEFKPKESTQLNYYMISINKDCKVDYTSHGEMPVEKKLKDSMLEKIMSENKE